MQLAAIIQARMGSHRLPGKSMADIMGRPLLSYVIEHAKQAVDSVIIATPDQLIADYADSQGVLTFLGDENDVLGRYYLAACEYEVETIIRMTADNPLIDPQMVKALIKFYEQGEYDWAANCRLKITYPVGNDAEICSFKTMEKASREATDPADREHVSPYIYHHPDLFKLGVMESPVDLSHLRWTVDTPEDLERVRAIYAQKLKGA